MELIEAQMSLGLEQALEVGGRALALAQQGKAVLVSAALDDEATVLGALQRADTLAERSTVALTGGVVRRRLTTGTEVSLSGVALYHAFALPKVDALFPDASPRTLLNRNLRPLLRAYAGVGIPLRYFGTEVLTLAAHPVAIVGYERAPEGAVLIELFLGLDAPVAVRSAIQREAPTSLRALLAAQWEAPALARALHEALTERLDVRRIAGEPALAGVAPVGAAALCADAPIASVRVPIGVVEASASLEVTGDILASTAALRAARRAAWQAIEQGVSLAEAVQAALSGEPLDGARPADIAAVMEAARARTAQL